MARYRFRVRLPDGREFTSDLAESEAQPAATPKPSGAQSGASAGGAAPATSAHPGARQPTM